MELGGHSAALAHKKILPDERPPGFERVSSSLLDHLRDATNFRQIQNHRHVVKTAKRQRNLADIRVPGAFSHAVNRSLDPGSTAPHRRYRTGSCHSKIIMPMEVYGDACPPPLGSTANEKLDRFGSACANGIDYDDLGGARVQYSHVDLAQKIEIGSRSIDRKKCDG